MAAAPAHVGDLADGRDRTRWFPALVGNDVVDLVNRYQGELAEALTHYVQGRAGYDYHHHAEVGSSNAEFVSDDVVDRFAIVGGVEDHIAKLRVLAEAGVDQFNLYLMNGTRRSSSTIYGREIIRAARRRRQRDMRCGPASRQATGRPLSTRPPAARPGPASSGIGARRVADRNVVTPWTATAPEEHA